MSSVPSTLRSSAEARCRTDSTRTPDDVLAGSIIGSIIGPADHARHPSVATDPGLLTDQRHAETGTRTAVSSSGPRSAKRRYAARPHHHAAVAPHATPTGTATQAAAGSTPVAPRTISTSGGTAAAN